MHLRSKYKISTLVNMAAALFLLLSFSIAVQAASPETVIPVKIGHHDDFTRIVFDLPQLSAYHIKTDNKEVILHLDINARTVFSTYQSPLIENIKSAKNSEGLLEVTLSTKQTVKAKHYRLQRKIIIDIYPDNKTTVAEKKPSPQKTEPKENAPAVLPKVKPDVSAPPAPETKELKTEPTEAKNSPDKEKTISELKKSLSTYITLTETPPPTEEDLKPIKVEKKILMPKPEQEEIKTSGYNEDFYQKNPTIITFSFLEPTKIAAFKRSRTLWVVTDSTASSAFPSITGPLERFIAYPQILRMKQSTAYNYQLPKDLFIKVKKQNLLWKIYLHAKPAETARETEIKTYFNADGKGAKMSLHLEGAGESITLQDPLIGDTLKIVPTSYDDQSFTETKETIDFETLPAEAGMVIRPLVDDLKVYPVDNFVFISTENGLRLTPEGMGTPVLIAEHDTEGGESYNETKRLFDFPNWSMGGVKRFLKNKQRIENEIISAAAPEERAGAIMKLAMLHFANNYGHETLGLLQLLKEENPEMENNSIFMAIRGAAGAMSGQYKEALRDLSYPAIQHNPEAKLWMGFAAAATEQWTRANSLFPKSNRLLIPYPDTLAIPLTIYMAESSLHLGNTDLAKKLLDTINMKSEVINIHHRSAISYLRGEIYKQKDNTEKAEKLWLPVANGVDRLYHTKATLSLTQLMLREKKISVKEAIERLENLRFAWRGDGVEIEVLKNLGILKAKNNQPLAGLEDLDRAVQLSRLTLNDTSPIISQMAEIFVNLFVENNAGSVKPLEAISVYNEFNYLIPSGDKGVIVAMNFAEHLMKLDLLKEAADIVEQQMDDGLSKKILPKAGTKLAAIYLLDRRPKKALAALIKTEAGNISPDLDEKRSLLKARAYIQNSQTDMATLILNNIKSKDAALLKADILWKQEKWREAAKTLEETLPPPDEAEEKADLALILNTAVAWKLAGNDVKLKEIKNRYTFAMANTEFSNSFTIVTREPGASDLTDRKTTLEIASEADVFKSFLDNYRSQNMDDN